MILLNLVTCMLPRNSTGIVGLPNVQVALSQGPQFPGLGHVLGRGDDNILALLLAQDRLTVTRALSDNTLSLYQSPLIDNLGIIDNSWFTYTDNIRINLLGGSVNFLEQLDLNQLTLIHETLIQGGNSLNTVLCTLTLFSFAQPVENIIVSSSSIL